MEHRPGAAGVISWMSGGRGVQKYEQYFHTKISVIMRWLSRIVIHCYTWTHIPLSYTEIC